MKTKQKALIFLLATFVVAGASAQAVKSIELPEIITRLPEVALPVPSTIMKGYLLQSEDGQLIFWQTKSEITSPTHSHKSQWGMVIQGSIELTTEGVKHTYGPGDSYYVSGGTVHSAIIPAGTILIELFEEPDRYKRK